MWEIEDARAEIAAEAMLYGDDSSSSQSAESGAEVLRGLPIPTKTDATSVLADVTVEGQGIAPRPSTREKVGE